MWSERWLVNGHLSGSASTLTLPCTSFLDFRSCSTFCRSCWGGRSACPCSSSQPATWCRRWRCCIICLNNICDFHISCVCVFCTFWIMCHLSSWDLFLERVGKFSASPLALLWHFITYRHQDWCWYYFVQIRFCCSLYTHCVMIVVTLYYPNVTKTDACTRAFDLGTTMDVLWLDCLMLYFLL